MSGIDSDLIRGHIDTIILKSLYHGDKYGLEIIQEVEQKSGGTYELKQPTLYSCLKRLESQGLISSYWEDSDIGGKRHYYKLTDLGRETYTKNQEDWLRSRAIIDNLIYNTTVDYAPIYDNDADAQKKQPEETEQQSEEDQTENVEEKQEESNDFVADNNEPEEDEFATAQSFANDSSFFDANNEESSTEEFEEEKVDKSDDDLLEHENQEASEVVNLNLDDIEEEPEDSALLNQEENQEPEENYYSATNVFADEEDSEQPSQPENDDDQIYVSDSNDEPENDDDQIYEIKPEYIDDEQESVEQAPTDNDVNQEDHVEQAPTDDDVNQEDNLQEEPQKDDAPTYINFASNNYDEADITNIESKDEPANEPEQEEVHSDVEDDTPSIEDTANAINAQYYSAPAAHASEEEINKLYRTTENYENLQANYTDETYKQALNELESYGGGSIAASYRKKDKTEVMSFEELKEDLEKDGISISKHERQLKETDDSKLYVKANEINMIKNWLVWGTTSLVMLIVFGIMSAFRSTYTYNFAFWEFAVAMAAALVIPAYSTIRYFINPYRKTTAKFAPRLSILINLLISVQLVVITYCVNLQIGFYSFSQENYNHLLWILPLILSFIPVLQSLTYMFLFNSKRFHV